MMERRGSKDSITARRRSIFGKHGGRSREHGGSSRSSRPECAAATVRLSLALPLLCLLSLGGADAAFTSSSLAFAPAQVGVGSEMSVSFTSDAAFSLGDIVSIVLPSFGEGRGSFSPTVVSEQPFRTASWNAGTETLSFTSRGSIAANKACRIMIPQDQAIHLPSSGIRVGATGLTITSGGVSGNIGTVPAVGSFRTSTSLSFSPRYTVAPVAIAIGFTPECDVATSELITFTLPGFSRGGDSAVTVTVTTGSFATSATWVEAAATLTLTSSGANAASSSVVLSIPSASSLTLPPAGIPYGCETLLIASNAVDGPVLTTSVATVEAVGVVTFPSISFLPRTAGAANDITLALTLSADLAANENVTFVLPGFTGADVAAVTFAAATSDGNPVGAIGSWTLAGTILSVQPQRLVDGEKVFSLTVAASNGISLPAQGLVVNATGFLLSISALLGGVSSLPFSGVAPVGAFSSVSLALPSASARAPATLVLSWSLNAALVPGDTVTLTLPGFSGDRIFYLANISSSSSDFNFSGSWLPAESHLVLTASNAVSADVSVTITVPLSSGIRVPSAGVASNQAGILISTDAAAGPSGGVSLSVAPVGAFLNSSLDFSPRVATADVNLLLRFTLGFAVDAGEEIWVSLPDFRGEDGPAALVSGQGLGNWTATWAAPLLTFTSINALASLSSVLLTVNTSILLPLAGVLTDEASQLAIGSNAAAGPSAGQPILSVQAVGVFSETSVGFGVAGAQDARAGEGAAVRVSFTLNRAIRAFEKITLSLPGFTGAGTTMPLSQTGGGSLTALWASATKTLTLTAWANVTAGVALSVTLSHAGGLVLPAGGVAANDTAITISTNAAAGPSDPTPVLSTEGIVALMAHSLALPGGAATVASDLALSFTASCPLSAGDTLTLLLPGFTGADVSNLTITTTSGGAALSGSWESGTTQLVMTVGAEVGGGVAVSLVVAASNGLALPSTGVPENTETVQLSVSARAGSTAPVSLASVSPVGAFLSTSLDFTPRVATVAGTDATLTLAFSLSFAAEAGEGFNVTLPSFRFPLAGTVVAGGIAVGGGFAAACEVLMGVEEVSLRLLSAVPATSAVVITIPAAASIHLPLGGVPSDVTGIMIKSSAAAGPSAGQAITQISAVGVFLSSRLLFTPNASLPALTPIAGTAAPLILSFALNKPILAGERVWVILPGFSGGDVESLTISDQGGGADFLASWTLGNTSVTFTANASVAAGVALSLTVDASTLLLPSGGVHANDTEITISTNAAAGPSDATPVLETSGVTAISGHSLFLTGGAATVASNMTLTFTLSSPLRVGDTVSLLLPDFTGASSTSLAITTSAGGAALSGSWDAAETLLVLTVNSAVAGGEGVSAVLQATNGIAVPSAGVTSNTAAILLSVAAFAGSSGGVSLASVSPVGAFTTSSLSYSPRTATVAGLELEVTLGFSSSVELERYDLVELALPGFRGPADGLLSVQTGQIGGGYFTASWSSTTSSVILTSGALVTAGTLFSITLEFPSGIALPAIGAFQNDPSLTLGSNFAAGPSGGQPIATSPAVGVFLSSSLDFSRRVAAAAVGITANFTLGRNLTLHETITFTLPGFAAPTSSPDPLPLELEGADASLFSAEFSVSGTTLTLNLTGAGIQPGETPVSVVVPSSAGLQLPVAGVPFSGSGIAIATDAASGPVTATEVLNVAGVGAFTTSSVFFGSASVPDSSAGAATSVGLAFSLSTALASGETVTLILPGFGSPDDSAINALLLDLFVGMTPSRVSWSTSATSITLTAGNSVASGTAVVIIVSSANGLSLPPGGVERNDAGVTLQTNAALSPAEPSPVASIEPVGVLLGFSLSFFGNGSSGSDRSISARAGANLGIAIQFMPSDNIASGDVLSLLLPDFTGGAGDGSSVTIAHALVTDSEGFPHNIFTAATFNRASGELRVLAGNSTAPADVALFVTILPTAGIRAPASGLVANLSSGVLAGCNCSSTPQPFSAVSNVAGIDAAFLGVRVNALPAAALAYAPQTLLVQVSLEESGAGGLLAGGDRLALRPLSESCLAARFNDQAVAVRSHDLVLVSGSLTAQFNATDLIPGRYAVCYSRGDVASLAGVDSETGLQVQVQRDVISAQIGTQQAGTRLSAPRSDFLLTVSSARLARTIGAGDAFSLVIATSTCAATALSQATAPSSSTSGLLVVSATVSGSTTHYTAQATWPACGPSTSPPPFFSAGACPASGVYRLCFRNSNTDTPVETGISVTFITPTLTITTAPPSAVTVDAPISSISLSLTSDGAACCQGTRVLASLLKNGIDYSAHLGVSNPSIYTTVASVLASKEATADAGGVVTFTDLVVTQTAGANFSLLFSVPNATIETGLLRVLPAQLAFEGLPSIVSFADGDRYANLTFSVVLMDASGHVLANVQEEDAFAVAIKLQAGGSGLDMGSQSSFADSPSYLQNNLLPASARSEGISVADGAANFSGEAQLRLGNMAGSGFRLRVFLVSDTAVGATSESFRISPASLALSSPLWNATVVGLSGPYLYGSCDSVLGYDEASCTTWGGAWTASTSAFPAVLVSLLDGSGATLTHAVCADCAYASLVLLDAPAPCGCVNSSASTTTLLPANPGCACASALVDGVSHSAVLVGPEAHSPVPRRPVRAGVAAFGGLRAQYQAGRNFSIRVRLDGSPLLSETLQFGILPHNLLVVAQPGGSGVDAHGAPPLNSDGTIVDVTSANDAGPDETADGVPNAHPFATQPSLIMQGDGYNLDGAVGAMIIHATLLSKAVATGLCTLDGDTTADASSGGGGLAQFRNLSVSCAGGEPALDHTLVFSLEISSGVSGVSTFERNSTFFDSFAAPVDVMYVTSVPGGRDGFRVDVWTGPVSRERPLTGILLTLERCDEACASLDSDLWQGGGGEQGTAQGGSAWTVTLAAEARATDDYYAGHLLTIISGTGAGQAAVVANYSGATRRATLETRFGIVCDASSTYHLDTDGCGGVCAAGNESGALTLPLIVDASSSDTVFGDSESAAGILSIATSLSPHGAVTASTHLLAPPNFNQVVGIATLQQGPLSITSTEVLVADAALAGIRAGVYLKVGPEIMRVTHVASNRAVKVAREVQGSTARYILASPLPANGRVMRVLEGQVVVGNQVQVGAETMLVTAVARRGQNVQELTVARAEPADHANGATLYNLHAKDTRVEVFEDACTIFGAPSSPATGLGSPCAAPLDESSFWTEAQLSARLSPAQTTLQVRNASGVSVGSLLRVGAESLHVTGAAIEDGVGTLDVTRNVRGTPAGFLAGALEAGETLFNASGLAGAAIAPGGLIQVDAEIMAVSSVNYISGFVTVDRAQESTSDASHASGARVYPLWGDGTPVRVISPRASVLITPGAGLITSSDVSSAAFPAGYTVNAGFGGGSVVSSLRDSLSPASATLTVHDHAAVGLGALLRVNAELLLVTAKSGAVLTVQRGVRGSVSAAHSANAPVLLLPPSLQIQRGALYKVRATAVNSHFRSTGRLTAPLTRAVVPPPVLAGFARASEEAFTDGQGCFCNASFLLSFAAEAPSTTAPRQGFIIDVSTSVSFPRASTQRMSFFDRRDDGIQEIDATGTAEGAHDLAHVRILRTFRGQIASSSTDNSTLILANLSAPDNFYTALHLALPEAHNLLEAGTWPILSFSGDVSRASVVVSETPGENAPFEIGPLLARYASGRAIPGIMLPSLSRDVPLYFRVAAYNRAGVGPFTTFATTVTGASPRALPTRGGALVVSGTGLAEASINIGGRACPVESSSADGRELRCLSPPGAGARADLVVISPAAGGGPTRVVYEGFFSYRRPVVSSVVPSKVSPGANITIFGSDFGAADPALQAGLSIAVGVSVGGADVCARVTKISDAEIRCLTSERLQSGGVVVTVSGQASVAAACTAAAKGGCMARAESPLSLWLTLALPFESAGVQGTPERAKFEVEVVRDVAAATASSPARFRILSVLPGSIIVEIQISAGISAASLSPAAVASLLAAQASDPTSLLRSFSLTAAAVSVSLPAGVADLLRREAAAVAVAAGGDAGYEDECPRLPARSSCLECCTYQCESQGGPLDAPAIHPGQVPALCLRKCSAEICVKP